MTISAKVNLLDAVPPPFIDVVNERDLIRFVVKGGGYLDVEISLFLEKIGEISLSFIHQVAIYSSLGIYRDQLFLPASCEEGENREFRSRDIYIHHWSLVRPDENVSAVCAGFVFGMVEVDTASEPPVARQIASYQRHGSIDPSRRITLTRLQSSPGECRAQ